MPSLSDELNSIDLLLADFVEKQMSLLSTQTGVSCKGLEVPTKEVGV